MGTGDKLILGNKHPYIKEILDTEEVVEHEKNQKRAKTINKILVVVSIVFSVLALSGIITSILTASDIFQCIGWCCFVSIMGVPTFIEVFTYDWVWSIPHSYTKYLVKIDYYTNDGDQAQKKVATSGFTYTVLEQVSENVCWVKQEERKEDDTDK